MTPDETLVAGDNTARAFAIGRDPANDIVIKDTRVSRRQALVTVLGDGRYHLVDRGSANGTFVLRAGHWLKVEAADVLASDRIRFGDRVMIVAALFEPPPRAADIFISYSSADRDIARMVAGVFSAEGWKSGGTRSFLPAGTMTRLSRSRSPMRAASWCCGRKHRSGRAGYGRKPGTPWAVTS